MKVAYLDCFAGIAGDMLLAALIDAGSEVGAIREALAGLPVTGWRLDVQRVLRNGISAAKLSVAPVEGAELPHHLGYRELAEAIRAGGLSERATQQALAVLTAITQAEASVHGKPVEEVHFHEVGGIDTLVDVAGAAVALELLGVERVASGPIPLSHGFVECAHGRLPVPPPAVTELVKGVPTVPLDIDGETVTPTGAALAVTLADSFGPPPAMTVEAIGYGAGTSEWEAVPNVLRVVLGETSEAVAPEARDTVLLEANIDDMPAEHFALAMERCFEAGAMDVWLTPIQMKKNRPATMLSALAALADALAVANAIFTNTTTFGIRQARMQRVCLPRHHETVSTPYGDIRVKVAETPDGGRTAAPEYEDCLGAAKRSGVSLRTVYRAAMAAMDG
jgi:uncharacterized protein (TIGR00299 family) protein